MAREQRSSGDAALRNGDRRNIPIGGKGCNGVVWRFHRQQIKGRSAVIKPERE